MALDSTKNFGKASLSAGYAAGVTSIVLATGEGAKFPQPSSEGPFNLVWWNYTDYGDPSDDPSVEIVRCTARTTDTLTIVRAQEGTSDVNHNTSLKTYKVILALTAKMIVDVGAAYQPVNANLTSLAGLSHAIGDLIYATAATTYGMLADVAVGAYLRSGGVTTAPLWSTLILPNAATAYRLPVATSANTIGELAAVGATGQYLSGVTGAIPAWQDKAPLDSRDYATLEAANTAAYNSGKQLLVAQNHTLTANTVLTAATKIIKGGSFSSNELLTLDVAPTPADFAAGATITGATSTRTCVIISKLTSTTYRVKNRTGAFTLGEVLSDGTNSADQGAANPTFTDAYTLAFNGPSEIGLYQVFIGFSAGDVTFGAGAVESISATWWGFSSGASAATNKSAIVLAISTLSVQGREIKLPPGAFNVGSGIDVTGYRITISGAAAAHAYASEGVAATTLNFTTGDYGFKTFLYTDSPPGSHITIKDLTINGGGVVTDGIRLQGQVVVKNVFITANVNGIRFLRSVNQTHLDNVTLFQNSGYGLLIDGNANTIASIKRSTIRLNGKGVGIIGVDGNINGNTVSFSNCVIESNTSYGLYVYGNALRTSFTDCWFENNDYGSVTPIDIYVDTPDPANVPRQFAFNNVTMGEINLVLTSRFRFENCSIVKVTLGATSSDNYIIDCNVATTVDNGTNNVRYFSNAPVFKSFTVTTPPYIQQNLLNNSGFGVWSNSTLENVGSPIAEDDCVDDSTAGWNKSDGVTLNFDTNHYEILAEGAYSQVDMGSLTFIAGGFYKIQVTMNQGTATAPIAYFSLLDETGWLTSSEFTLGAGNVVYSYIFKARSNKTGGRAGVNILSDLSGGKIVEFKLFSLQEVIIATIAANTLAADSHSKTSTLDAYRIADDTTHLTGGYYGLKLIKGADTAEYYNLNTRTDRKFIDQFKGRTVTFGTYVYSGTAIDNVKVQIYDGVGTTESSFVGADAKTWVEVTRTISTSATQITPRILFDGDTSDIAYVSPVMMVFGSSIGAGNYAPIPGEIIWTEQPIALTTLDGITGFSDMAMTTLNMETESSGKIPKGAVAVYVRAQANDSGSLTGSSFLALRADASQVGQFELQIPSGLLGDSVMKGQGWQKLSSSGDMDYQIDATGSGTFDIPVFKILGVQVN